MSDKKSIAETRSLFNFNKEAPFDKKKLLNYAGITFGAISLLFIGRYALRKIDETRLKKLYESKRATIEEKLKSKAIVDLRETISDARLKSTAIVELHTTEEIVVPAMKGKTLVKFVFSYMENLNKKYTGQPKTNPFLPPFEEGIFILDLSPAHRLLFNKFAVVKHHVLIVTSAVQEQTDPLNSIDLAEAYKVLFALKGFCFYNSGPLSGASQPHKHLQVMSNFQEDEDEIVNLINKEAMHHENPFKCSFYQFAHLVVPLPNFDQTEDFKDIGAKLEKLYIDMIQKLKINTKQDSYNFIMNENWMMIVRRSKENAFDTLSVNSLGFIGRMLLKGEQQRALIKEKQPFQILESITLPA